MTDFEELQNCQPPSELDDSFFDSCEALPDEYLDIIKKYARPQPAFGNANDYSETLLTLFNQAENFKIDEASQSSFLETCRELLDRLPREIRSQTIAVRLDYQLQGIFNLAFDHLSMFQDHQTQFLRQRDNIMGDPEISDQRKEELISNLRKSFPTDSYDSFNSESLAVAISESIEDSVTKIQSTTAPEQTSELSFLGPYVDRTLTALLSDLEERIVDLRDYQESSSSTSSEESS